VGSALARLAFGSFVRAAREMKSARTFRFSEEAIGFAELGASSPDQCRLEIPVSSASALVAN
jgi:hypothetical protein